MGRISRYVHDDVAEAERWRAWKRRKLRKAGARRRNRKQKFKRPDYHAYMKSKAWRRLCWQVREAANGLCRVCGNRGHQVHHLTYKRLGRERLDDLALLCGPCHEEIHAKGIYERNQRAVGRRESPGAVRNVEASQGGSGRAPRPSPEDRRGTGGGSAAFVK